MKKSVLFITSLLTLSCSTVGEKSASLTEDSDINFDPIETGIFDETLVHNDEIRAYLVYIPEGYNTASEVPLMLNFHGFGDTSASFMNWADMRDIADNENFILVYPQGSLMDGSSHWNAALESDDNKSEADDFGFIESLIDSLATSYRINTKRVYASGYSNGGMFAYSLACYHGDKIAAIGTVSGAMLTSAYETCNPTHPTATIVLHGTSDSVLSYDGGDGFESINDVIDYWVGVNNANTSPTLNSAEDNGTTIEHYSYTDGDNGTTVEHFKIYGGGHVWFDIDYSGSNTSLLIWNYVSRYDIDGLR